MIFARKHLMSATMICGILLLTPSLSHSKDLGSEAISMVKEITSAEPKKIDAIHRKDLTPQVVARRAVMDRLLDRNQDDIAKLLRRAEKENVPNLDIYAALANLSILNDDNAAATSLNTELLKTALTSKDWRRQSLANLSLGALHVFTQDNFAALEYAQKSLECIPVNLQTFEANEFRYNAYDLLYTTFVVDRNTEKAVAAAQKHVEYGQSTGREIDHVSITHNLSVAFSKSRDFETASALTGILVGLQADQSLWSQAVAHYGHGTNLSEAGHFDQALPYLETASRLSKSTRLENPSNIRLALALAKTGRSQDASDLIKTIERNADREDAYWQRMQQKLVQAKAEIAFHQGLHREAYTHLNQWASDRVAELEGLLSEDRRRASQGLVLFERVAQEKEARLNSEIAMSQQIAKRGNMIAVFAGLLVIALGFITFNLNRQRKRQVRINAELASARDRALAGEETKSKFISMMGHELRTPMNPIISLADILHARADEPDTKQMLRMISASGRAMLSMVENILIVADQTKRKLTISTQKINIRDFIRFATAGFQIDAEDKGLSFTIDVNENVPQYMTIDKLKLRGIVTNMLSNAVKFTPQGSIIARILMVEDPRLGKALLISIKDTGIGMTQDEMNALRAAFQQQNQTNATSHDGIGVGLYVTELYAKAHGGRMAITSHPKDGTQIDVYIPQAKPAPTALAA